MDRARAETDKQIFTTIGRNVPSHDICTQCVVYASHTWCHNLYQQHRKSTTERERAND